MRNLALLTDLYKFTVMQGYFENENVNQAVIFDMFYHTNPEDNGYATYAGFERVIDYIKNPHFTEDEIAYPKGLGMFKPAFLDYLRNFRFADDIYMTPGGTVILLREPPVKVTAPIMQAQLTETALLNIANHQSPIATKVARIVRTAQGNGVMEFDCRRARDPNTGIYGTRAAVIAGCVGISNVLYGQIFGVPVSGICAHSWIMSSPDELSMFRAYAKLYPDAYIPLIGAYNTLGSGLLYVIQVLRKLCEKDIYPKRHDIHMDSGDLVYLSKEARAALGVEGFTDAIISASNSPDENLIDSLKARGVTINSWGVGTNLIISKDYPVLGGVYKFVVIRSETKQRFLPKIKILENAEKTINPGGKEIYRIHDLQGTIVADLTTPANEQFSADESLLPLDPIEIQKKTLFPDGSYRMKEPLVPVFEKGNCIYEFPEVMDVRQHYKGELATLWKKSRRLEYPRQTCVGPLRKLQNVKTGLLG